MGLTKFSAGVNALTTRHRMMILAVSFSGMLLLRKALLLMLSKSFLKLMKSRRSGDLNSARCSTMIRTSSLMWSVQEDRERKFDKFQGYFSYHLRDSRKFANIFSCAVVKSYVWNWNFNDRSFPPFVGEDLRFPGFTNEWEQQFCRDSGSYRK